MNNPISNSLPIGEVFYIDSEKDISLCLNNSLGGELTTPQEVYCQLSGFTGTSPPWPWFCHPELLSTLRKKLDMEPFCISQ